MHELSIAQNIVEICEEQIKLNNKSTIYEVEIEIGELSGVIPEALKFALPEATKNTLAEKTKFIITVIPAIAVCNECKNEFAVQNYYSPCNKCNAFDYDIKQGKDLIVKSIVLE